MRFFSYVDISENGDTIVRRDSRASIQRGNDSQGSSKLDGGGLRSDSNADSAIVGPIALALKAPSHAYASTADTSMNFSLLAQGGAGGYVFSLVTPPSGASINSSTGVVTYAPSVAGNFDVTTNVVDNDGTSVNATTTIHVLSYRLCVWTGAKNSDFSDRANWQYCGTVAGVPGATEKISIDSTALNWPLFTGQSVIDGIGPAQIAGGTLRIGPGSRLGLSSQQSIQSSIVLEGETPSCTTCQLDVNVNATVVDDATLTLKSGIKVALRSHNKLFFGDGTSAGHLVVEGGSDVNNWPVITGDSTGDPAHFGLDFQGSTGQKSRISINGLKMTTCHDGAYQLTFTQNYEIVALDNLEMHSGYGGPEHAIIFQNCPTAIFTDKNWNNITIDFVDPAVGGDRNVEAMCDPGATITIQGFGDGAGASLELDSNSIIDWQ